MNVSNIDYVVYIVISSLIKGRDASKGNNVSAIDKYFKRSYIQSLTRS